MVVTRSHGQSLGSRPARSVDSSSLYSSRAGLGSDGRNPLLKQQLEKRHWPQRWMVARSLQGWQHSAEPSGSTGQQVPAQTRRGVAGRWQVTASEGELQPVWAVGGKDSLFRWQAILKETVVLAISSTASERCRGYLVGWYVHQNKTHLCISTRTCIIENIQIYIKSSHQVVFLLSHYNRTDFDTLWWVPMVKNCKENYNANTQFVTGM